MKKATGVILLLATLFLFFSCATTTTNTDTTTADDEDVYSYYTVPERSDNLVFSIYTAYTFPTKKDLTDDESNLMAVAFLFGMEYCAGFAGQGDNLAVAFMYDNSTAKTFISTYKDYKLYADGKIDTDEFWERLSIEDIEY